MKKKLFALLIIILLVICYSIGNYFVNFALKRIDPTDINSSPPAADFIKDKTISIPDKPDAKNEIWNITSRDKLKLFATHFSPEIPDNHNWAILVHGYGREQRFAWDYAAEYLKRGYEVLTPDLRASGTSEGTYLSMGDRESDDILIWIDKILEADPQARIVLHGVSMGAATVLIAAAKSQSPHLVAVIEDCGYTSAYNMFTDQLKKIFGLPEFPIMSIVDIVSKFKTGTAITEAAPILFVSEIDVPTLFIHGTGDKLVPFYMMQQLYDHCKTPVKEFITFEDVGHASSMSSNPDIYFNRIFSFLKKYVNDKDIIEKENQQGTETDE